MNTTSASSPDPIAMIHRYIDARQVDGLTPNTLAAYKRDLLSFNAKLASQGINLLEASTEHITDYVRDIRLREARRSSVARYLTSMREFFKFLTKNGIIQEGPQVPSELLLRREPPPPFRLLSVQELGAMLEIKWPHGACGERNLLMLKMLAWTSFKTSEITALKMEDIDLATGKGPLVWRNGRYVQIILGKNLCEEIEEYISHHRPELLFLGVETGYLFPAATHEGELTRAAISQIIKNYRTKVGIREKVSPKDLHKSYLENKK